MLITFLALLALVNAVMGGMHNWGGHTPLHIAWFSCKPAGKSSAGLSAPVAWLIGIPWSDRPPLRAIFSVRAWVINEFVAFPPARPHERPQLDPRSFYSSPPYALCGVAEFQLHRHPNRRHRPPLAPSTAATDARQVRHSRHASRLHGKFDVRLYRRHLFLVFFRRGPARRARSAHLHRIHKPAKPSARIARFCARCIPTVALSARSFSSTQGIIPIPTA